MIRIKNQFAIKANPESNVKKVIAIASGKGGVGKSSITSMLAVLTQKMGAKVGIIDADITGPSIPKAFGVSGNVTGTQKGIEPRKTKSGIDIMSLNLLVDNATTPVIWRAPIITNTIKQFWSDVVWGEKDVLFIDLPPGTADASLTVFQSLPIDGVVIVTSPQELVGMIVEKSIKMAEKMNIPILALVENLSGFVCPDCGKEHNPFGKSRLDEIAKKYNINLTAKIPMNEKIAQACDAGTIENFECEHLESISERIFEKKC